LFSILSFKDANINTFLYKNQLNPGNSEEDGVVDLINNAQIYVFFLITGSIARKWCGDNFNRVYS